MLTAISICSIGRPSTVAISLYCRVSSSRRWSDTICQATPPWPLTLSICSSRHSRRLRAPTPAGSSDCTTLSASSTSSWRVLAHRGDLLQRRGQIAILVQVADDGFGGVADLVGNQADAQLRAQVVAQGDGRGKEGLERGLFHRFRGGALVAGIEIVVEKRAEIDFVERVRGGRRFRLRGRGSAVPAPPRPPRSLRHPERGCR